MSNWKNVNNWHWVNKNCIKWVQKHFDEKLVGLEAEKEGMKATVTKVVDCTGDADLNQRKGKMTTIYDITLKLDWEGTLADGTNVQGTISIPEIAHDTEEDEYVFEIIVKEENSAKLEIKPVIRKALTPLLIKVFSGLSVAMIQGNSDDVYIESDKLGTAAPPRAVHKEKSSATQFGSSTASKPEPTAAKANLNTVTIHDTVNFQTSAQELYETIMDTQRAMVWTRGPVRLSKEAGSHYELFGGNVSGEILELVPGQKIVQSWRLRSWPAGHFSKVTMTFVEGSESVDLKVEQTGVPVGEEELTRNNWSGYYWRAIKASFGYGANF
ncbi:activator of Hsp90 ATPase [Sporodiniella umbellata]|nr:activator of Hsp90 ATPase [Sporodiniella umbellata]